MPAPRAAFFVLAVALSLGVAQVASALPGDITTVAGGGGSLGDSGPATSAQLNLPAGVAFDGAGNLFIADRFNHRIRKVDTNGIITTVAGTGVQGFSGDVVLATNAQLNIPVRVTFDGVGNLFIADFANQRIRKVDTNGVIDTAVGTGVFGFSGDGGLAASAQLNGPVGIAFDATGNLFIADQFNSRIRKVDTGGIITTVAGTGAFGFSGDGGPATSAQLNGPLGVTLDATGNLFIVDRDNQRIRKVDTSGIITTVAGTGILGFSGDGGPATSAQLNIPDGVAFDAAGNLFIADLGNERIRKVDTSGIITTVAGTGVQGFSGDGGPATSAALFLPVGVAFDAAGNLFIGDGNNNRIRKVFATPAGLPAAVPYALVGLALLLALAGASLMLKRRVHER